MIAQIAPAVRVAIAETMGLAPGEVTVGQMVTGLRQIGFDLVFGELQCVCKRYMLCRVALTTFTSRAGSHFIEAIIKTTSQTVLHMLIGWVHLHDGWSLRVN